MRRTRALDWLTSRPVAHRGLHDRASGIVENTESAFAAAIAGNYGIETDLQISADGEAMVYHDDALGRLTEGTARLASLPAAEIQAARFRSGGQRIMTLGELCDFVAGRAPLVLELKSRFDGDTRLVPRVAQVLAGYKGPAAAMSFDPQLVAALESSAPQIVRGIIAERHYADADWSQMSAGQKFNLAFLLHAARTRPQFVAYAVHDLPALSPLVAHYVFGLPLLTWTVRDEKDRSRAERYGAQIIFEGFRA